MENKTYLLIFNWLLAPQDTWSPDAKSQHPANTNQQTKARHDCPAPVNCKTSHAACSCVVNLFHSRVHGIFALVQWNYAFKMARHAFCAEHPASRVSGVSKIMCKHVTSSMYIDTCSRNLTPISFKSIKSMVRCLKPSPSRESSSSLRKKRTTRGEDSDFHNSLSEKDKSRITNLFSWEHWNKEHIFTWKYHFTKSLSDAWKEQVLECSIGIPIICIYQAENKMTICSDIT